MLSDEKDEKPAAAHFQRKSSAEKCTPKLPDEASRLGAEGFGWFLAGPGNQISVQAAKQLRARRRPANQLPCVKIFNTSTQRRLATEEHGMERSAAERNQTDKTADPNDHFPKLPLKMPPASRPKMKCINKAHAESGQDMVALEKIKYN